MEDHRGKFVVLAAGYPDNMNSFLMANPGLNSRFDKKIHFEDYGPEELWLIAESILKHEGMTAREDAKLYLQNYFDELYKNRDKFFGNARSVRQTIDEAIKNQNLRMAALPAADRSPEAILTLTLADVEEFKFTGYIDRRQAWAPALIQFLEDGYGPSVIAEIRFPEGASPEDNQVEIISIISDTWAAWSRVACIPERAASACAIAASIPSSADSSVSLADSYRSSTCSNSACVATPSSRRFLYLS